MNLQHELLGLHVVSSDVGRADREVVLTEDFEDGATLGRILGSNVVVVHAKQDIILTDLVDCRLVVTEYRSIRAWGQWGDRP